MGPAQAGAERGAGALSGFDRFIAIDWTGARGVRHWNRQVEHWLSEASGDPLHEPMYVGRPLLVTANDYEVGLYNGDTGVIVRVGDTVRAAFARGPPPRPPVPPPCVRP